MDPSNGALEHDTNEEVNNRGADDDFQYDDGDYDYDDVDWDNNDQHFL